MSGTRWKIVIHPNLTASLLFRGELVAGLVYEGSDKPTTLPDLGPLIAVTAYANQDQPD